SQIIHVKDHVGYYIIDDDGNRTWYPDNDIGDKPLEGFEFVSIDQAYAFYKDYGKRASFDVRKGGHYKPKPGEDPNLKWFLCSKEGKNPELVADKSKDVTSNMCGGFDRVGATVFDCKNQKKKMNLFIGDRDAQMAVEKILSRKLHTSGFYVNYKLGDDDKLVGLFWADDQAIRDYAVFGDIVSFDTTFRSNKESWIPAFLRDELMAGLMRTTSRSKSENHFFGKWTSPHLTLMEFLSHYNTAIQYQRYIEHKNDHDSRYKNLNLKTDLQMEKEAIPKLNSKDVFSAMLGVNEPTLKNIGNPDQSSNKGTGVHFRWKSKAKIQKEAAQNSKKRICSKCENKEGHNSRTCINERVQPSNKVKKTVQATPTRTGLRSRRN
nr:FAR1 DNA binding domain, zinc finger, SWIM-type, MULE transposase domain, FHY3/FAR1 family [Tanacetum cinerariifolium]